MTILHRDFSFSTRSLDEAKRSVRVIASTDAVDSYGEILVQDWDLARYLKNPVVLWGHESKEAPIGFASEVAVEDGKLVATLNFVDAKASPKADEVWHGIQQGSLRAVSVGFNSRKAEQREINGRKLFVLSGNELIEISVVPVPANPDAIIQRARSMRAIRELAGVVELSSEPEGEASPGAAGAAALRMALLEQELVRMKSACITFFGPDGQFRSDVSEAASIFALQADLLANETKRADLLAQFVNRWAPTLLEDHDRRVSYSELAANLAPLDAKHDQLARQLRTKAKSTNASPLAADQEAALRSEALDERERELEQRQMSREIDALVAKGLARRKLTPAMEPWARTMTETQLRMFINSAPAAHPALDPTLGVEEPRHMPATMTHNGKSWSELKPMEMHDLFLENPDLYRAMKENAQ